MRLASQATFCEILLITIWSHGLHSTFIVLGMDIPSLPAWEEMKYAPSPLKIRYTSLLYRTRIDDSHSSVAPIYKKCDINTTSDEYAKIPKDIWDSMVFLPLPTSCVTLVPRDLVAYQKHFGDIFYLTVEDFFFNLECIECNHLLFICDTT